MIEIKRQGLLLTISESIIPSQGSSKIPVHFVNDLNTYQDFIVMPTIGWYNRHGCYKSASIEFDEVNSIMYLPADAFLNNGTIAIAVGLLNSNDEFHKEVTLPVTAMVSNAPLGDIKLPDTDTWETAVMNLVRQLTVQIIQDVEDLSKELKNEQHQFMYDLTDRQDKFEEHMDSLSAVALEEDSVRTGVKLVLVKTDKELVGNVGSDTISVSPNMGLKVIE